MVNNWALKHIEIIKVFFSKNLSNFNLTKEVVEGPYWLIQFTNNDIIIEVKGDIAFEINIFLDESKYPLWSFDKIVNKHMETNKKNISIQLEILKIFFN